MHVVRNLILLLVFFLGTSQEETLLGQSDSTKKAKSKLPKSYLHDNRKWVVEIPIWVPGFAGEFAYGNVSIEGEDGSDPGTPEHPIEPPEPGEPPIGGGNILTRLFKSSTYLKFFFVSRIAYKPGKWLFQLDGFSGSVGNNVKFKWNNNTVVRANFQTNLFRSFAGFSLIDHYTKSGKTRYQLYGYAGARFHFFHVDSRPNFTDFSLNLDPFWAEPILGVQGELTKKNWKLVVLADIGSFWINENFSTWIQGKWSYRISRVVSVKFGWTNWYIINRSSYRGETLYFKVHLSGPTSGISFHF